MSARETLLAAIATALGSLASGRVYRSRREQLPALPAIVVEPQSEEAQEIALGSLDRRLTVNVMVFAKGDTPDSTADDVLAGAWTALTGAAALNAAGAQLEMAHGIDWDFEDYDMVRASLRITINYRTATTAM